MPIKHGNALKNNRTSEYRSWDAMIQRCTNPNCSSYPNWGGRGIEVSSSWRNFENFLADMGEKPGPDYSIHRINDGNYEKGACRWATKQEQGRERRDIKLTISKASDIRKKRADGVPGNVLAKEYNISQQTVCDIYYGRTWNVAI